VFKPGQALNFPESILKETKKIFLIYDSYEDGLEEKRFSEDEIICIHDVYEYLVARGEQRKVTEGKLLDFLQQTRNRRIFSECYVPLMLEGEVAGYIRLLNDIDYHRSIKPAFALRTVAYADILVEALVKYDYFRLESGKNHEISVLNISAGGLLFRLDDERLKKYIIVNTVIQMSILLPGRSIEARGIVYRIETKRSEYGAKFQEINETDMKYIDDLANKRIQLS
jgi:hypothetical protein